MVFAQVGRTDGGYAMRNIDPTIERLKVIRRLIGEARDLADHENEYMLGAKLDDCAGCVEERIASFSI